jgi:asparagine synthase (glutamine-hydrolysing)
MTDRMMHRGPDDEGFFCEGNVGLGMRRLSIIDLSSGHQPIYTPDGSKVIVFNGEAYNYRENRGMLETKGCRFSTNSDTEVVLQLFDQYGTDCLKYINGMFGFAVWDKTTQTLTIARDRIGIKPLYYYKDEEKLVFASEIKSILAFPGVIKELDQASLAQYFKYGFTPDNQTLYKNIRKLPPACHMTISEKGVKIKTYWKLSYADKLEKTEEEICEELYDLMLSSVKYRMIADVPLGAFLSSGIDSSSIVHMMHGLKADKIDTYSIGFGAGYEQFNELEMARKFADQYNTNHHEITVRPDVSDLFPELITQLDEPLADSSFIMTYLVSKLARQTSTVILSGVGGDELFGGYRRYLNVRLNSYFDWMPTSLKEKVLWPLISKFPEDRNSKLLNYFRLLKSYMETSSSTLSRQYLSYTSLVSDDMLNQIITGDSNYMDYHQQLFDECDSQDILDKMLYIDLKTSLPEQLLMLTDKMSMITSLEARVPYLDHRVVEYAARIPAQYKIKGFKLRHIQKKTFKNKIPDFVFDQKKKGFGAPVGNWVRGDLKEMMMDLLSVDSLKSQGLFNPDAVHKIINTHLTMQGDYTDILLGMISFQIWWRQNDF